MGKKPPQQPPKPDRLPLIRAARDALRQNQLPRVVQTLAPLLQKSPPDAEALYLAGLVAERQLRPDDAITLARQSLASMEHPDTLRLLASSLRKSGDLDEAVRVCDRLLALKPGSKEALAIKADALQESGALDASEAALDELEALLQSEGLPIHPSVLETRARVRIQQSRYDEAIGICDSILGTPSLPPVLGRLALFTKAKACDRAGQYDEAFEAAAVANRVGSPRFDPEAYAKGITQVIEQWSGDRLRDFPVSSCQSEVPVFIAGMPRSGTSLVDQIIDAHPDASGVGELNSILRFAGEVGRSFDASKPPPDCFGAFGSSRWTQAANAYVEEIRKLAPGSKRIVNKALGNDVLVGLISRLFPKTRIIHLRRDPRDVAISCFMGAFNTSVFPWTSQIDWTIRAWEESERLMAHWKQTLDTPILELRYEDLVRDPKRHIPELLGFLGLQPSDACFEFHARKRRVRTLSHDQVSRPMYTSSVGRSANYANQIKGYAFPAYEVGA